MARRAGTSVQLVAKEGEYATLRLPSTEMRRVPDRLPGHRRRGRQRRARADQDRQGRPQPLEGRAPPDPRCGHEPRRPPARWWRGQDLRWSPPGVAVGQARGPHPQTRTSRPRSSSSVVAAPAARAGRRGATDATQPQEGPVRRRPPAQEGGRPERAGREEGHQDLVAPLHDHPRHGRSHHRRARRPQARARSTSPSRWSVTSSASSPPPGPSSSTPARRRAKGRR